MEPERCWGEQDKKLGAAELTEARYLWCAAKYEENLEQNGGLAGKAESPRALTGNDAEVGGG